MTDEKKSKNDYSKMSTQLSDWWIALELIICWDRKQRERDIKLVIKRDKDDRVTYWLVSIKSNDCSSYILEEAKKNSI
jgi:hypothetical protein